MRVQWSYVAEIGWRKGLLVWNKIKNVETKRITRGRGFTEE